MGIRLANYGTDLSYLLRLNEVCYPDESSDPTVPKRLGLVLRKNPCWVTEESGLIAGCLLSEISNGQPYIWSVCVDPTHRGKGLATTLIQTFEKHYAATEYKQPWLHVRVDNPAQKLYFDLGYRVSSFERNIYAAGVHGLTMRKHLV